MNRCRSKRGKQPRLIPRSKSKYGVTGSKFGSFFKNLACFLINFCRPGASPAFSWFPDSFWRTRFPWLHFSAVEGADVAKLVYATDLKLRF